MVPDTTSSIERNSLMHARTLHRLLLTLVVSCAAIALVLHALSPTMQASPTTTFNVDTTLDEAVDNTADNLCHTASNHCSLRVAVQQVNQLSIEGNPAGWTHRLVHVADGLRAEPNAPQAAGTFTVNGTGDNTDANNFLTLREALLLVRGGTDGSGGLGRGLTDSEKMQISGTCTWSGTTDDRHITGGCGPSIADKIVFDMLDATIITLSSVLPHVDDSAPTVIDGTSIVPQIDASAIGAGNNGLRLVSNGNTVSNLVIRNSPANNFYVAGDHNTLDYVRAWNAGTNGIFIAGSNNVIQYSHIGVSAPFTTCNGNKGNTSDGVQIAGGAFTNTVDFSEAACNGDNGILVFGRSTILEGNSVFQNGRNGLELSDATAFNSLIFDTAFYSNTLDGINERNGATANQWTHISTYANGGLGIDKNGDSDGTNILTPPFPIITSAQVNGGNVIVRGTATPSQDGNTVYVELYRATPDDEGQKFIIQTNVDGSGQWTAYDFGSTVVGCYTTLQIVTPDLKAYTSSEFGPSNCHGLYLPLIER
jgi:hypothetical protein